MADETPTPLPGYWQRVQARGQAATYALSNKPLRAVVAAPQVLYGNTVDAAGAVISSPLLNLVTGALAGAIRGAVFGAIVFAIGAIATIGFPLTLTLAATTFAGFTLYGAARGYNAGVRSQYGKKGAAYGDLVTESALGGKVPELVKQAAKARAAAVPYVDQVLEDTGFVTGRQNALETANSWQQRVRSGAGAAQGFASAPPKPEYGPHTARAAARQSVPAADLADSIPTR